MVAHSSNPVTSGSTLGTSAITDRTPKTETFTLSVFAGMVEISRDPIPTKGKAASRSTRGRVKEFSRKSRKRLIEKMAKTRRAEQGHFITLTFPGEYHGDHDRAKAQMMTLKKRIQRRFPGHAGIWRMELKRRLSGASEGEIVPHFHIITFGLPSGFFVEDGKATTIAAWLPGAWREICDGDDDHQRHGCDVKDIQGRRQAMHYASKYASKLEADESIEEVFAGRHWGTWGDLELTVSLQVTLTRQQLIEMKRLWRSWLRKRGSGYARSITMKRGSVGCSLFGWGDENRPPGTGLFETAAYRLIEGTR